MNGSESNEAESMNERIENSFWMNIIQNLKFRVVVITASHSR